MSQVVRRWRKAGTVRALSGAAAGACAWLVAAGAGAVVFTDVTASAGIAHTQATPATITALGGAAFFTGGVAAGDFDGDGWVDLVFSRLDDLDVLYRNRGDGTFEARTAAAGFTTATRTNGVVAGDVDNDGDLDLYMTGLASTRNFFYLNDGHGVFTDVGLSSPATLVTQANHNGMGAAFGDYDNDGYLDLATGDWGDSFEISASRLFHNVGASNPGAYQDVSHAAGVDVYRHPLFSFRFSPRFADLDRDGKLDLTFTSDFAASQLFWNDGDGTFTDGTVAAGTGLDRNGMGATIADYDGDGDLDWFVSDSANPPGIPGPFGDENRLYQNNGNRTFAEVSQAAGVRNSRWSWGTQFFDYDNDGDLDLAVTNGYNGNGWVDDQTVLWQNNGGVFTNVATAAGIVDTQQGRGLATLDYDADGDLDLVIVNNAGVPILYRNDGGNANHYLRIAPQGVTSNRDGVGAWITVTPDLENPSDVLTWEIEGGSSFLSLSERTAHFGLGTLDHPVDLVTIAWPSGLVQTLHDVALDQTLLVIERDPCDFNSDGAVDAADLGVWQASFAVNNGGDANGDGVTNGADLLLWQRRVGTNAVSATATVPEPQMRGLVAMLAIGLAAYRRRR